MNVDIQVNGSHAMIMPHDDMAGEGAQDLRPRLIALLAQGIHDFTFDLAEVTLVDSTALGLLIMCHNSLRKRNGQLDLINVSKNPMDLFRLVRLDRQLKITPRE